MAKNASVLHSHGLSRRFEVVLLHLAVCAILLPVAAQGMVSGFIGLFYLFRRGGRLLSAAWQTHEDSALRALWQRLLLALAVVWGLHLVSLLAEIATVAGDHALVAKAISLHLHLLGKHGVYGVFIVMSFALASLRRSEPLIKEGYLLGFSLLYLVYMLGQRSFGWDWVHGFDAVIGTHRLAFGVYRPSGFMGHPLTLAYNAMIFCLVSFGQGLFLWLQQRRRAGMWLAISGCQLGVVILSGSRLPLVLTLGLLFAVFTGKLLVSQARNILQKVLGAAFVLVLAAVGFMRLDSNLYGRFLEFFNGSQAWEQRFDRLLFWKVHLQMGLDQPLLGVGLARYDGLLLDYYVRGGYNYLERKYTAHNIYLQTFADSGLLGCLGLLCLLAALKWFGIGVARGWGHVSILALAAATILGGLMQNNLRDSEYLFAVWACLGLTVSWLLERGAKRESAGSRNSVQQDHQS